MCFYNTWTPKRLIILYCSQRCIRGRRGKNLRASLTHSKSWSSSWSSGWRASANENATTKQKKANFIFSSWRTTNRTTSRMRCIEFSSACVHYNPTVKIDFEIMLNKISELEKVLSFSNASPRLQEWGRPFENERLLCRLLLSASITNITKSSTELSVLVSYLFLKELK